MTLRLILVLASCALLRLCSDATAQDAAPAKATAAFSFADVEYQHRYSHQDLHEFTPLDQPDLKRWSDMVTINFYPSVTDGEGLAKVANAVLANYKTNGGRVIRTNSVPMTKETPAEHLIMVLFRRPEFAEATFIRLQLNGDTGASTTYSRRVYGEKSGEVISEWLKNKGLATEKVLMKWDGLAALELKKADEPVFETRTLTSWLQDFAIGRNPDMDKHHAAERAIRSIGNDVLPFLVKRLEVSDEPSEGAQDIQTVSAFRALGTEAAPAIPALIQCLAPSYDAAGSDLSKPEDMLRNQKSIQAALALQAIGEASIAPLTAALRDKRHQIRFGAAMALEDVARGDNHLGVVEQQVVPALIKALKDENRNVRWRTARTLGDLHAAPEKSVAALAERVRSDQDESVKIYAIWALQKFGKQAESALPDLQKATTDVNPVVCDAAKKAITAIRKEIE
ncbi:MAG: repeat protein [Schlesneria sp.]|nr:repeat protein [Schlesneria sp.]